MMPVKFKVLSLLTVFASVTVSEGGFIDKFDLDFVLKGLGEHNSSTPCGTHIQEYLNGLATGKQWAVKMYDSSANKLYGKFMRQNAYINGYEECLLDDEYSPLDFRTHYCVLNLHLYNGDNESLISLKPGFELEFESTKFHNVRYGICLPRTCRYDEIETSLKSYLNKTAETDSSYITLSEESCSTKEAPQLKGTDWLAIDVILLLVLASISSTAYDITQQFWYHNNEPHALLKSFSIYTNLKIFLRPTDSRLKVLDGMRTLSCFWIVFFHVGLMPWFGPVQNFKSIFLLSKDLFYVSIQNGVLAVDTFFFLSGLLVAYTFFKSMKDKGFYDVPRNYIHRYLRLTPSLALLTLVQGTIFSYFADAPLWKESMKLITDDCSKQWWRLLSFTQNYGSNGVCMGPCWYLSADMQLFWLSPLLLFPLYYRPALAPFLLTIPTLIFTFLSFGITYAYDFNPSLLSISRLRFEKEYSPTHTRGAPWMIGLALGYMLHRIKHNNKIVKLPKAGISMVLCFVSFNGIIYFMYVNATTLESASYIAFHRVGWALGLAWIVFACEHGYGGLVNAFLSWKAFQPLAKLSYGVYLIHILLMMFEVFSARGAMWVGDREGTYFLLSTSALSLLSSLVLLLHVDIPFTNIDRYVFRNVKILPLPKSPGTVEGKNWSVDNEKQLGESGSHRNGVGIWSSQL